MCPFRGYGISPLRYRIDAPEVVESGSIADFLFLKISPMHTCYPYGRGCAGNEFLPQGYSRSLELYPARISLLGRFHRKAQRKDPVKRPGLSVFPL